jgi:hypothetical protein
LHTSSNFSALSWTEYLTEHFILFKYTYSPGWMTADYDPCYTMSQIRILYLHLLIGGSHSWNSSVNDVLVTDSNDKQMHNFPAFSSFRVFSVTQAITRSMDKLIKHHTGVSG